MYVSVLKMHDFCGLGIESCFFGARDDGSGIIINGTSSTAHEFAVDVHEVGKVFGLFILWRVGSFLCWVHHFFVVSFNIDNNYFISFFYRIITISYSYFEHLLIIFSSISKISINNWFNEFLNNELKFIFSIIISNKISNVRWQSL